MNDKLLEEQFIDKGEISGDGLPRDGLGRYILPHPVTGERRGRTRVTTMAKLGDSGRGLAIDRERKVVRGMGLRPDLMARAGAVDLVNDPNAKKLLSEIAEAAYIHAGGTAGSNFGTAQHSVFEQYFLHKVPLENLAEYFHADIKCIEEALAFHQLRLLPQYIERVVYSFLYDRGGKIDAIVEHIPTGDLYIFDLKTEEDPAGHPEGKTVQLAYYANADGIFNYETGQWEPMPKVRTDVALIVHVRPGKGAETDITKAILTVPIDEGWAGVRICEMMRSWRQRKLVIAPFMSMANWQPKAPVNVNGDVFVGVKTIEQLAQEAIDGNMPLEDTSNTPMAPYLSEEDVTHQRYLKAQHDSMVDDWQNKQLNSPMALIDPETPTPVHQQTPGDWKPACACATPPIAGQTHHPICPHYALTNGQPITQDEQSNTAQINNLIDNTINTGQQIDPTKVAKLNQQAAQVVAPGTPHTIYSGIDTTIPEKIEGVPDSRPPAPKSELTKMPPMEHLEQLLKRPIGGINPQEEAMELAQLTKDRLKELIHYASGKTIPIDDPQLKRNRKPLADILLPLLNQQRQLRDNRVIKEPEESPLLQHPEVQQVMDQARQHAEQLTELVETVQAERSENGFVDLSYDGILQKINEARNPDQLNAIYNQVIATHGQNGWHPNFNDAASRQYAQMISSSN
jgi:hypothetical protein